MNTMHDVIVIGAGPSGSMTAKTISSKGFSVNLIERRKRIGYPLQCAEAISEFCLRDVGLQKRDCWSRLNVDGVKVMLPNDNCFYSIEPRLSIDRPLFDKWLADEALNNGTELNINTTVKGIKGKKGDWNVKTNKGEFKGKVLIGADGPLSQTARRLGLLKNGEHFNAIQYKFNAEDVNYPENKWLCFHMDERFKGGYGWVFPRGNEYNIGVGGPTADIHLLKSFCKSLNLSINKKKEVNAGLIPFNFEFGSRAKNGVIIVGDAAGMTNPMSGGGIHAGLSSGKMAGEITVQSLESENLEIIEQYDKKIKKTPFLHPYHLKTARYLQNWTEADWDFFGEVANGTDMMSLTLFKSFLIGLKYPRYMLRARELLTIRKTMQINKKYS